MTAVEQSPASVDDRGRSGASPAVSSAAVSSVATVATVAIVGMGYVGLPTALGLHRAGLRTIGIDLSPERLRIIESGQADLTGDDLVRLDRALRDERFELTADPGRLAEADAVIVCVPTPLDRHLVPDLAPLRGACASLVAHAIPGQTLILTSTSFVGTTRAAAHRAAARARHGGRHGRVRRVQPGTHRPRQRRPHPGGDTAGHRRGHHRVRRDGRAGCSSGSRRRCTWSVPQRRRS